MPAKTPSRTGTPRAARPRIRGLRSLRRARAGFSGGLSDARLVTGELNARADWMPCSPETAVGLINRADH